MDPVILVAAGLGFLAVLAVTAWVWSAVGASQKHVLERVQRVTETSVLAKLRDLEPRHERPSFLAALLRPFARLAKPQEGKDLSKVKTSLSYAGYRSERVVEMFFGAKLALAAVMPFVYLAYNALRDVPAERPELWAVLSAAAGFYAPNMWLRGRVQSRQLALNRALPDTLDLIVTCVESGLGLDAALTRITQEMGISAPELTQELQITANEIQAGMSRADAFRRLADRTGLEELRSLAAMLIQSEMFGTGIARALRVHSSGLRTRRTHRAEEKGATVSVKLLLPLILFILPSLFAVVLGPAIVRIHEALLPAMAPKSSRP